MQPASLPQPDWRHVTGWCADGVRGGGRALAPGMQSASLARKYSHKALRPVRSWPVLCTASSAGTDEASASAAPCLMPAALGSKGSEEMATSWYLTWPSLPRCRPLMKLEILVPELSP